MSFMAGKEEYLILLGLTTARSRGASMDCRGQKQSRHRRHSWRVHAHDRKHVEHIFSKLNVENRTAAAATALAVLY